MADLIDMFDGDSLLDSLDGSFSSSVGSCESNESWEQVDGSPYQAEIIYNRYLPYAYKLDEEADKLLGTIKANYGKCVMLRDINPGCVYWSGMLKKYISLYGLRFSKEEHLTLIKLHYELVTISELQPSLINTFGGILVLLLKKKKLISPAELELPWEPLFKLSRKALTRSLKTITLHIYPESIEDVLERIIQSAKVYFSPSATQEILTELRPQICPWDFKTTITTFRLLRWFLPVQLDPKYHSIGHELWFSEFMQLWEKCHNDFSWEGELMELLSKLAANNVGYIDWNPYIPFIFTRVIRSLDFPLSYKNSNCNNLPGLHDALSIGQWIASVLGNNSNAQDYLDKFLKTIETHFHPANNSWQLFQLEELIIQIVHYVVVRLHKERYSKESWESNTPESHKLTEANVDAFVNSIMPIIMTGVCSDRCSPELCKALQQLATIRANLVIPSVLEKLYPTIGTDIEPHKLITAMHCMVSVARPLVQGSRSVNKDYAFPEGPKYVLPLLFSALPGLDPNDPNKSDAALKLIGTYVTLVPVVDCSASKIKPDDENERQACEESSRFEDFVLQFMDKLFALIESSSLEFSRSETVPGAGVKSFGECMTECSLNDCFTSMMLQANDAIFNSTLNKFRSYIMSNNFEVEVSGQSIGAMCQVFSNVNGKLTFPCLFPYVSDKILEALEDESIYEEEDLDNELQFPLLLMEEMMTTQGDVLVQYLDKMIEILDKALKLKCQEGHFQVCNLILNLLQALSRIDVSSFDRNLNDPEYPYWMDWGKSLDLKTSKVIWHVPGEKEYGAVQKIFDRYFNPALDAIKKSIETKKLIPREELLRTLKLISSILEGCHSVLPFWFDTPLVSKTYESCLFAFNPEIGNAHEIVMPDGSNVRRTLVTIFTSLQELLLQKREDDTKNLKQLLVIWHNISVNINKGMSMLEFDAYHSMKDLVEDKYTGDKGFLPELLLRRVFSQHEKRKEHFVYTFTETTKEVLSNLFKLSLSQYSEIRKRAQTNLSLVMNAYPNAYETIFPRILEVLNTDTDANHDAYKGTLYLLSQNPKSLLVTKNDWNVLSKILPALVLAQPSEKPSIFKCQDSIVDTLTHDFTVTNIKLKVPDECVSAASKLWDFGIEPSLQKPSQSEIEKSGQKLQEICDRNVQLYYETLNNLIRAIVEEDLHWRHRLMAMKFITFIAHPEHKVPTSVVRYFVNALISESLDERKQAWLMTVHILQQLKRKMKKVAIEVPKNEGKLKLGPRADNAWLQYSYDKRPLTAEQWDEPRYVHQTYIGYYTWPKKLEVYAPASQQPTLDKNRELNEHEKEIVNFFENENNISKLIEYLTLEEKKGFEGFNNSRYFMFKYIFRNHGDAFLSHFLSHVDTMVQDKQEYKQRFAAEFLAGLISGSKHWTFDMVQALWQQLLPIIKKIFVNITKETIMDWTSCFTRSFANRDPNKLHWLLECLIEESQKDDVQTSFIQCSRLILLKAAIQPQAWRLTDLSNRLLPKVEARLLENPFDNVRGKLASLLVTFFNVKIVSEDDKEKGCAEVDTFINKIYMRLESLLTEQDKKSASYIESTKLLITICQWMIQCLYSSHFGIIPSFYKLYPIMSHKDNDEKEEDLSKSCKQCLGVLAQSSILPEHIPVALQAIDTVSKSSSWSARASCEHFLQVLLFHNMSILLSNEQWLKTVTEIVLRLLEDEHIEVRSSSAEVLNGMIHCTLVPDRQALMEKFRKLAQTKLKGRSRESAEASHAIRLRHAGVLGLCAFIQAHPYDVPEDIPPIFEYLSSHTNDPEPIPTTIRKTLNDFKRTHCDGWTGLQGLAQSLTEEQFALLQDLTVPPLHYA